MTGPYLKSRKQFRCLRSVTFVSHSRWTLHVSCPALTTWISPCYRDGYKCRTAMKMRPTSHQLLSMVPASGSTPPSQQTTLLCERTCLALCVQTKQAHVRCIMYEHSRHLLNSMRARRENVTCLCRFTNNVPQEQRQQLGSLSWRHVTGALYIPSQSYHTFIKVCLQSLSQLQTE